MEAVERKSYAGYVVIVAIYAVIILSVGNYGWGKLNTTQTISTTKTIKIDWQSIYPFEANNNNIENLVDTTTESTENLLYAKVGYYLKSIPELMDKVVAKAEILITKLPLYKKTIAPASGFLRVSWSSALKEHIESALYAKTDDGYFINITSRSTDVSLETTANNIADLDKFCDEQSIPFLYVLCPAKTSYEDEEYIETYSNENKDRFADFLTEYGVDVLDMRDLIEEQDINWHSLFYRTDHHWNVAAGLWAAGELADVLNENYGFDVDTCFYDESLYESKIYDNAMFGSIGQGLGHVYADSEDFEILLPTFDTSFRIQNADKDIDETGTFAEVMYDEKKLLSRQSEGGGYVYETLIDGTRPLTEITNLDNPDGIKILMIRDSFSLAVAPYLALSAGEIDLIDVRSTNGNFTGSVRSFIKQEQPDIVIMLYNDAPSGYTYK